MLVFTLVERRGLRIGMRDGKVISRSGGGVVGRGIGTLGGGGDGGGGGGGGGS